ncbi:cell division protein FtsZ [Sphingorhabdus wooponensis]|jgi:cell division protein FtsZ|uniref:Cell division protein FtsZ n=1 Tax=Sphingorhabdus wooponensis TaxID=940136 RepID=A0A3R8R4T1_9SPHN|nr:cell division protein FtsZ [Sphingorhabdus wooponensis]RRQ51937.1 cell division protein FtsZ [Sphingorhabdus wooponensis]
MSINIGPPMVDELKPKIAVIGVGGAGGNAVANMISAKVEGVDFVVANTDAQALNASPADYRIQLGPEITQGLGAGSRPEVGRAAAEETIEQVKSALAGCHMCFIAAGMGGGTGTGAAPVIAQAAREMNILTVGVVTKPFLFEGSRRMRSAESGIAELQQHVDTLIVIPNQNLFLVANPNTTFKEAFLLADEVLQQGVRGITDLMVMPGLINLDFADVRSVMHEMGKAMMGTGEAEGDGRALEAAERAIANPLLDGVSMQGAKGVIVSITGGEDMRLMEVDEAANHIRELVDPDANIIWGSAFNENLNGKIRVSVVATGIDNDGIAASPATQSRTPFSFSRPAPEPVAAAPAPTASLFETTDSAPAEEDVQVAEPAAEAEDDSLVLGSDFEVPTADEEASEQSAPETNAFSPTSWAGADALELNTPADENANANAPSPAPVDVTQAPERAAPRIPTGGTLFERMSNLSRGLSRSDDDDDKGAGGASSSGIPRFLDRQNNS